MLTKEQIEFFKRELEEKRDRIKMNLNLTSKDMDQYGHRIDLRGLRAGFCFNFR